MLCTLTNDTVLLVVLFILFWEVLQTLICLRLQKDRFLKTGWEHVDVLDMMTVYSMLPQDDVAR